jgi:hypothetical protein
MEILKINTSDKYNQQYVKINKEIYSLKEAIEIFPEIKDEIEEIVRKKLEGKTIKPFKYPFSFIMKIRIEDKIDEIIENINLKKSTNAYQNMEVANKVMFYLFENTTLNMRALEDRILSLQKFKEDINKNNKSLDKKYNKNVYNKDKEYKKTIRGLKKLEKRAKQQKQKVLYNALNRGKITNLEEVEAFVYLLNKLNIKAYKMSTRENGKNYYAAIVPIKNKQKQHSQYYIYDLSSNRQHISHPWEDDIKTLKENKLIFRASGFNEFIKNKEELKVLSFENNNKSILEIDEEFKKIKRKLSKESIDIYYVIKKEDK